MTNNRGFIRIKLLVLLAVILLILIIGFM